MKLSVFFLYVIRLAKEKEITVEESLIEVKKMGYTGVELDMAELAVVPNALELFKKHNFAVTSVYGECDILNGDLTSGYSLIDTAKKCGADKAMILPGCYSKEELTEQDKKTKATMYSFLKGNVKANALAEKLKKLCEYGKEQGVVLTIEDFGSSQSLTAYICQIEWLFKRVKALRFTFDTGNFYLNGQDVFKAYRKFKKRSIHVHLKDFLRTPPVDSAEFSYQAISVPVGGGEGDVEKLVKKFLRTGYDGYFVVEYLGADNFEYILRQSATFMLGL